MCVRVCEWSATHHPTGALVLVGFTADVCVYVCVCVCLCVCVCVSTIECPIVFLPLATCVLCDKMFATLFYKELQQVTRQTCSTSLQVLEVFQNYPAGT
jgi:hypothetical protein